ncbi:MAG: ABC transporter ATP-binding protein [Syntrophobacteraceae bacterium]|nr:ABC transporter ATP-binding protein [Desulfobacteraceae bacterium]
MAEKLVRADISKRFSEMDVLRDIRFEVEENEFLVVVGPTGCGKTTLGNILSGLEKPTEGSVKIRGEVVDPHVHNISYVFQEPSCIPWYTMIQDVTMGLVIKKVDPVRTKQRGLDVIKLVGLEGFEDYYPWQISGGMKQRVAIARAYATDPDLLIMDEPFGHLDAQTRYLMQIEIMRIWEQEKKTVIFITNNIEEAVYLAGRIIILSKLPARIKGEYKIDLERPRDLTSPEFLKLRAEITQQCEVVE